MLLFSVIVMLLGLVFIPVVNGGPSLWPVLIVSSFLRAGCASIINVLIFEIEGVGNTFGGTAIGLTSTIGMIGSFAAPPLGNSLAAFGPGVPFYFWAALTVVALPLFLFLRKPGGHPDRSIA